MIYLVSMVFVLSVLIFFHELGHFLAAKLFGVRVERFSIGFPPRLFGIKIGETDYCISAIPFGGYVKLSGMIDESLDASTLKGEPWEFMSKPLYQRVIIISAGVIMNMILAVVLLIGITWHQGEQIIPTTTVGYIAENGVSAKIGFQKYDRILAINGRPVSTWNEVSEAFLENLGSEIRFEVERNGQIIQLVLDRKSFEETNMEQLDILPLLPARVGELTPGFPAEKAGLQKGDQIIAIDGQPVTDWENMTEIVRQNAEKPLNFTIVRGSETLNVVITPQPVNEIGPDNIGKIVGKIGIGPYFEHRQISFFNAIQKGIEETWIIARLDVKALGWLITGRKSPKEILAGPVMITKMAGDFARAGFFTLLMLVAHLSIMLAIVNILPIPALDGGHLAIMLVEAVRRKPLSVQTKMRIQQVGMALIMILILFVIYNDVSRLLK